MAPPPLIAGRYEIVRPLGQGAFGRTFLATDRDGKRNVAIKLMATRDAASWKAFELFEREASVLRSLRHQGIPEIYDSLKGEWEGGEAAFLVMEHVEGSSLEAMLAEQRHVDHGDILNLLLELLGILEYLHGRVPPILHRDIKPSNIIVRPNGYPVLVDFGSVRRVFLGPEETGSTVAGTYGYMPYEQYMGQASPASDLYAAAATMLHVLTGRPPRDFMTQEGRLEVPAELPGDARLRSVIARMLRPSPAERFASAHEVRQALLQPGTSVEPEKPTTALARRDASPPALPAAPRTLEGPTREHFERLAYSAWRLMDGSSKESGSYSLGDLGLFVFFSVITGGILPLTFVSLAGQRRRRLKRFFREGVPGVAEVLGMELEDVGFSVKLARVSYEFQADGEIRRDADQVLPVIAHRWRAGDRIQILYLPASDYDSVIISTS